MSREITNVINTSGSGSVPQPNDVTIFGIVRELTLVPPLEFMYQWIHLKDKNAHLRTYLPKY